MAAIVAAGVVVFAGALWLVRSQETVHDVAYMKAMIPHHSIAIKTCEYADLDDPETIQLCDQIVETQREEIAQMEDILERLG